MPDVLMDLDTLCGCLSKLRCPFLPQEELLHQAVADCLEKEGLSFLHEAIIGPHCRIDFLVQGIGIEIKKAKPNGKQLLSQLERYAACEMVQGLIVLLPGRIKLPTQSNGKPIRSINLNALWGVALS